MNLQTARTYKIVGDRSLHKGKREVVRILFELRRFIRLPKKSSLVGTEDSWLELAKRSGFEIRHESLEE